MSVNKAVAAAGLGLVVFEGAFGGATAAHLLAPAPAQTTIQTNTQDTVAPSTAPVHGTYNKMAVPSNHGTATPSTTTTTGGLATPSDTTYDTSWDATTTANDALNNMTYENSYDAADEGYNALYNIADSPYATTNEVVLADTAMQADNQVSDTQSELGIDSQVLTQIADGETTGTTAYVLALGGDYSMNDGEIASTSDQAVIGSVFAQSIATNADDPVTAQEASDTDYNASYQSAYTATGLYQTLFQDVEYYGG